MCMHVCSCGHEHATVTCGGQRELLRVCSYHEGPWAQTQLVHLLSHLTSSFQHSDWKTISLTR